MRKKGNKIQQEREVGCILCFQRLSFRINFSSFRFYGLWWFFQIVSISSWSILGQNLGFINLSQTFLLNIFQRWLELKVEKISFKGSNYNKKSKKYFWILILIPKDIYWQIFISLSPKSKNFRLLAAEKYCMIGLKKRTQIL